MEGVKEGWMGKRGYWEEEIKKVKGGKGDGMIGGWKGEVVWEVWVEGGW